MSLFTVEQIELIRRLRQTGITLDQIVEAFRSLDRLEQDVAGVVNGCPRAASPPLSGFVGGPLQLPLKRQSNSPVNRPAKSPKVIDLENEETSAKPNGHIQAPVLLQHLNGPPSRSQEPSQNSAIPGLFPTGQSGPWRQMNGDMDPARQSVLIRTPVSQCPPLPPMPPPVPRPPITTLSSSSRSPTMLRPPVLPRMSYSYCRASDSIDCSTGEDPVALEELLKNGEEQAITEIKSFVAQYQLRQTNIAQLSGVSQPYISKFLNGNFKELSARVRATLYGWFLKNKKNPESLTRFSGEMLRSDTVGQAVGEFVPQRRERYVFRPVLLKVLEQHFTRHAYPDLEKRMEIAAECNRALAIEKKGATLVAKEMVTPQVVANWFANRRKEVKRRNSIGAGTVVGGRRSLPSPDLSLGLSSSGSSRSPDTETSSFSFSSTPPILHASVSGQMQSAIVDEEMETPSGGEDPEQTSEGMEEAPRTPTDAAPGALSDIQSELLAVSSNLLALVNPYDDIAESSDISVKLEVN